MPLPSTVRFVVGRRAATGRAPWAAAFSDGAIQALLKLYAAFADRQQALSRRGLCPLASPHTAIPPSLRTTPLAVRQSFARVVQLRRCRSYTRHEPLSRRPSSAVISPCPRNLMLEIILLTPSRLKSNNGKGVLIISAPALGVRRGLRWIEQHAQVAFDDVRDKRGRMHGASRSDVAAALAWVREARKGEA